MTKWSFKTPSLTYRRSHAGLVPGLQQAVKNSVIVSLRVAGVSWRTPQVCFLIATLLDFTAKVLQRILTVLSANTHKQSYYTINTVIAHALITQMTITSWHIKIHFQWILFFSRWEVLTDTWMKQNKVVCGEELFCLTSSYGTKGCFSSSSSSSPMQQQQQQNCMQNLLKAEPICYEQSQWVIGVDDGRYSRWTWFFKQ